MKVLAKILNVAKGKTGKGNSKFVVDMKSGETLISAVGFSNLIKDGVDKKAATATGKECVVELQTSVYNGTVQYQLGFGNEFATGATTPMQKAS